METSLARHAILRLAWAASAAWLLAACQCDSRPAKAVPATAKPAVAAPAGFSHRLFDDEAEALRAVLEAARPAAIGFGEYHQMNDTSGTLSAIERFTRRLLPALAGQTSDLVVETWVSLGSCGKAEKQVVAEVEEVSQRPAETENETVRLLRQARALGIQPHILAVQCADYEKVLAADGGLDYLAFLELVGARLGDTAGAIIAKQPAAAGLRRMVGIYCGAAHNDVAPLEGFEAVSFAKRVAALVGGRYVEVDLLVPEFVEQSDLARNEAWFSLFERVASPDHVALIELRPDSYLVILRRGEAGGAVEKAARPATNQPPLTR